MAHPETLTRIVTCQGGIQLIAALGAVRSRQTEQEDAGYDYTYDDILVIYDLYAPGGQAEPFASFIQKMAFAVSEWKAVIYLTPAQMSDLDASLSIASLASVFSQVHKLIGVSTADEIYLCRNWQFGNRLMLNAYVDAKKICYGDAVGIYFSEEYFSPSVESNGLGHKSRLALRRLKSSITARLSSVEQRKVVKKTHYELLPEVDFDIGYFLLPDILNQQPPMETRLVRKELVDSIFRKLAETLQAGWITDKYEHISRSIVVLMTSNFSEAARMSRENEIEAYRVFMKRLNLSRDSTLIIKPHPRDGEDKIQDVGRTLSDLFADVVLLTEPELFFVPFEIFLMQNFRGEAEKTLHHLKIITFSTACIPLEVLFHLGPIVGFGDDLVRRFFYPDYVRGRIRHEHDLRVAVQKLAQTT